MARVTARCYQGTILYLSQCWPRSMLHYGYGFSHVDLFQFNLRKQWDRRLCDSKQKTSNSIGFHTHCITLVLISHDMVMSHWFIQLNADRNVVWLRFDFFNWKYPVAKTHPFCLRELLLCYSNPEYTTIQSNFKSGICQYELSIFVCVYMSG